MLWGFGDWGCGYVICRGDIQALPRKRRKTANVDVITTTGQVGECRTLVAVTPKTGRWGSKSYPDKSSKSVLGPNVRVGPILLYVFYFLDGY